MNKDGGKLPDGQAEISTEQITQESFQKNLQNIEKYVVGVLGFDPKNILDFGITIKGIKPFGPVDDKLMLKDCRTYWIAETDVNGKRTGKYKQETICFGFEIIPSKFNPHG